MKSNRRIYLDHNATTPIHPSVLETMLPYLKENWGNPSSIHSFGRTARNALNKAREQVANFINAEPSEIIFTSGGTESNNHAIKGSAWANENKGKHIITSQIEHPAVLETLCKFMLKRGYEASYVSTDTNGTIKLDDYKNKIRNDTFLISVMYVNNEVGTIQPLKDIVKIAKEKNILVHTDAVQAAGKLKIDVKELGVDLLSLSGHKINAPKGIGALYVKKGTRLSALINGGHQERNKRTGTENIPGIVAFGKACELITNHNTKEIEELRNYFEQRIKNEIEHVTIHAENAKRAPNTSNISFHYVEGESIVLSLDQEGIAVSTGSACSSGTLEPSHVLGAMKVPIDIAQGAVRFSLGYGTTKTDIDYTVDALKKRLQIIRDMSPLYEDMLEKQRSS